MKKALLLTLPLMLMASQAEIDKKIQQLELEVKILKKEVKYHQEDLDERIHIIEEVEKKSILDKINFSPEILLRFDKLDYTTGKIEGEDTHIYDVSGVDTGLQRRDEYSKDFDLATTMRFRLNMNFKLDNVKFHGRLLYTNSTQANERLCILSRDIKTGTPGSAFDVDRAYVDYTANKNTPYAFTFSFGLLPTTGGTPMQYAQNSKRSSLFPALVFDMNTYGVIATQKLGENTYARLVLARPYTLRPNFYPYQCNRVNIDNANIVGLYTDTKFNFLGTSLLSFGINIMSNLKAHPYLGPDVDASNSEILGAMATLGLGIDIDKVGDTDTTLFLHTAVSNPHANGNKEDYKIVAPQADGLTSDATQGFTEADYASGPMLDTNGYSVYLGTKYDINSAFNIGAEFNYGSKYWYSATQGAEDMYNKLALRGSAYELYGVWKFHKYLTSKVGYLNMYEEYTGSGWYFGEPAQKDATQKVMYLTLEAKF